jgi:hypothetical protein
LGGLISIGKYFQFVSVVPASIIVLSLYALIAGGAPRSAPQLSIAAERLSDLGLEGTAVLAIAIVTVGMLMHPFQYAMTQALEGYWGSSRFGIAAMNSRATVHLGRIKGLETNKLVYGIGIGAEVRASGYADSRASHNTGDHAAGVSTEPRDGDSASRVADEPATSRSNPETRRYEVALNQINKALDRYPHRPDRTMPTMLGNTLRRMEDKVGEPYGLDGIAAFPYLMLVGDDKTVDMVDDAGTDMDLAVRFVFTWLFLGVSSFALLWPYGPWLAVPLAFYCLAWLSYRGAAAAAAEYVSAVRLLFDLNHWRLSAISAENLLGEDAARRITRLATRF